MSALYWLGGLSFIMCPCLCHLGGTAALMGLICSAYFGGRLWIAARRCEQGREWIAYVAVYVVAVLPLHHWVHWLDMAMR